MKRPDADFVAEQSKRMYELLRLRGNLPPEDLEYVVERIAKMKDRKLQECVAELIGWGDDERSEIETFIAIAIEVMKRTNMSKLRECARIVELRYYVKEQA
jgi:hypothetical protein